MENSFGYSCSCALGSNLCFCYIRTFPLSFTFLFVLFLFSILIRSVVFQPYHLIQFTPVNVSQSTWWRLGRIEYSSEGLNTPWMYTSQSPLCSEDGCRVKAGSGRASVGSLKCDGTLLHSLCSLNLVHIFLVFSSLSCSED